MTRYGATHFDRFNRFSRSRSCWWLHIIWFRRSFPFGFINLSSRPRRHVAVNRESRGLSGLHHLDALQHELWNVVGSHSMPMVNGKVKGIFVCLLLSNWHRCNNHSTRLTWKSPCHHRHRNTHGLCLERAPMPAWLWRFELPSHLGFQWCFIPVTIMSNHPTIDIEVDICLMYWNSTFSEYFKVQKVGWLVDVGSNPGRLMRSLQSNWVDQCHPVSSLLKDVD